MKLRSLLAAAALSLSLSVPVGAEVEWNVVKTLSLDGEALDVAVSADGKGVYVLLRGGQVQIYSPGGKLQESFDLGFPADSIALSPAGNILYAASGDGRSLQVVQLVFVQKISTAGSPVKGPESAPVTVAVFNDFQ